MALWDRVTQILALEPWREPLQVRSDPPPTDGSLADFIARIQGARDTAWRIASISEALSVPAIFGAVVLISNVVGSLSMRAFRRGLELSPDERPRLIIRPNPFTTPREFFRETAWAMAVYGEAWWWVPKTSRDSDGMPMTLIPVNPREIIVKENRDDLRFPIIEWRGRQMANADMIQIKMTAETGALRGRGPLQACGAAVSVAVEAQEWAANFFAEDGGIPSIIIKAATALDEAEATALLDQWMSKGHNQPRVIDNGIESVDEFGVNTQAAQMMEARNWQNGDVARMFSIPGPLLEYAIAGQSLTYQNVGQEFAKFLRVCLRPNYLEPMQQTMSDQLTRSTTSEFNTVDLERADIKTLFEVAKLGSEAGVFVDQDEARALVGLQPSVEQAAVPFSPPAAVPASFPVQQRSQPEEVRCKGFRTVYGRVQECGRLLGKVAPPYEIECPRCKATAVAA